MFVNILSLWIISSRQQHNLGTNSTKIMVNDNDTSFLGTQLLTVTNKVTKPQDTFMFRKMIGVDENGESIINVDMKTEFEDN